MPQVGVLEAKTHFSGLLEQVEKGGEEIVITRHGRPVAKLVAIAKPARDPDRDLLAEAKAIWARAEARGGGSGEPIDVVAWVREDRENR